MALPNKTFWCNYNARNYNSTTLTLPKENGQLFDNDLVFPSAVTYNDDHITLSGDKRVHFTFNSTSENIFNRTSSTANITIIAKLSPTNSTWFFANRDGNAASQVGYLVALGRNYRFEFVNYSYTASTSQMIFTWRCGNGDMQYIAHSDNVVGTPYQSTNWARGEMTNIYFFGGNISSESWAGDFYWLYMSPETLTDAEIQQVIDYNENIQQPVIPVNKYKFYTSNVQKTYNGSTQINKMYVGSNLVYRALPTTIAPTTPTNVDYVHTSTPTSTANYISTGIYPTTDTVFRLVYEPVAEGTMICGFDFSDTPTHATSDSNDYRYFYHRSKTEPTFDFNASRLYGNITLDSDGYADVTVGNNYITDNITQTTTTGSTQSTVATQDVPIYISVSNELNFRSFEIWQNNVKVYDGHAAVLNGEYGVYDSVGGTFTTQTYGGNSMSGGNI